MERDFYNEDFESLIKQKADQFRMYPSEKVWKEVNRSLHPRKKWYWYGFALLLSGIGLYSINNLPAPRPASAINGSEKATPTTGVREPASLIPFSSWNLFAPSRKNTKNKFPSPFLEPSNDAQSESALNGEFATAKVIPLPLIRNDQRKQEDNAGNPGSKATSLAASINSVPVSVDDLLLKLDPLPDMAPDESAAAEALATANGIKDEGLDADIKRVNWLQEYAVYELTIPKTKRISLQITAAPTMSYRKLTGGKEVNYASNIRNIPLALNLPGDVNQLVNHKPALGFEVGSSFYYSATKNISLKAGLQFNFSRYSIQAFRSPTELTTIALTDSYGFRNDSINSYSSYRNFGGYAEKDIQNHYYHFSLPVGAELKLLGNKKLQLNVAATVQPTYLLNRNNFLITTDYKNYTRQPSLTRKWNIYTSAETYISYRTGEIRWQLGPQFRYQLLSSYNKEYPIREFLMEYGVKFGVTKTIR